MSESNLIKAYRSILSFFGLEADDDGFVSTVVGDSREPALINGERLVLPLDSHLRSREPGKKVIFHPGAENILRGESDVIKKLLLAMKIKLNYTFGIVAQSLISLVGSPELHKKLTPDQCELLKAIPEVDDVVLRNFLQLMMAGSKADPSNVFVDIYLKRGGSIGEKRYARVGIVNFPLYKALKDEDGNTHGVKLRVKDKELIQKLYNFIYDAEHPEEYWRGSDSHMAPYLEALLHTSVALASRLNDILATYGDYIDGADQLMFDASWADMFETMDELTAEIRRIPLQAGNEGAARATDQPAAQPEQPAPSASLALSPPPAPAPTPMYCQPVPPGTPAWAAPNPAMMPAPAGVRSTERGLDFNDMKRANPALNFGPNAFAPMGGGMAMHPQGLPPPSWAVPAAPMGYPPPMYGGQTMGYPGYGQPPFGYPGGRV